MVFRSMARRISSVLVDLSGTLHVDITVIPGSVEALTRLRKSGLKIKFVTNTTKESKRNLFERLKGLNFDLDKDEIFTSLTAARHRVEQNKLRPMLLLEDSAMEDFNGISQKDPNAVVIGLAPSQFNYNQMNKAFQLLLTGASLIAIHKARYYKTTEGLALGPGPFVTALEYSSGTTAEVIGKPESTFFRSALEGLDSLPEEAVMIGDDVHGDIEGAQKTGLRGILVKTGKYRERDELKIDPGPYQTCEDFSKAVDYILNEMKPQEKT